MDNDGNITLPVAGKVHVATLTTIAATRAVTKALQIYYVTPHVTLEIKPQPELSITVEGAVDSQGPVQLDPKSHLSDALQQAGLSPDADVSKLTITRRKASGESRKYPVNYSLYTSGTNALTNPELRDGDIIFIPEKIDTKINISVLGDVNTPGDLQVKPETPISEALSRAGGLAGDADHHLIQVQHANSTTHSLYDFDIARQHPLDTAYDPVVVDGDKIIVPAATPSKTFQILGGVTRPGAITVDGPVSLSDAIALAGGLAPHAKLNAVTITRDLGQNQGYKVITVNATDPKVASAIIIQPLDVIDIQLSKKSGTNIGAVLQPLSYLSPLYWLFHL